MNPEAIFFSESDRHGLTACENLNKRSALAMVYLI
jgi:hypothetical protein